MPKKSSKKDPLFENPMVRNAMKNLSTEELEMLKKHGEEMFSIDFEKAGVTDPAHEQCYAQIKIMMDSGMHPSFLTSDEKHFLEIYVGEKWWEKFGYLENDVHRINL